MISIRSIALFFCTAPLLLNAKWELVSDFNSAEDINLVTSISSLEEDGTLAKGETGAKVSIENGMLKIDHGNLYEWTNSLFAFVDLGVDLQEVCLSPTNKEEKVEVYFELMIPSVDGYPGKVDVNFGLSHLDAKNAEEVLATRYNGFNALQRVSSSDDTLQTYDFDPVQNKRTYKSTGYTLESDVTYSFLYELDYFLKQMTVTIQGGSLYPTPTELEDFTGDNIFSFRSDPSGDEKIQYFMIATSRGNSIAGEKGKDPVYFDNLYVDIKNFNPAKWVDDALFGKVYTWTGKTTFGNWLWSDALKHYIYVASSSNSGIWAWHLK